MRDPNRKILTHVKKRQPAEDLKSYHPDFEGLLDRLRFLKGIDHPA